MRPAPDAVPNLRRVLGFWSLTLYGMGVIVGAGIYVALGAVIAKAGAAAPFSFLVAGVVAAMTGLCYAELAARFPEASGAAAYVREGFRSPALGLAVGGAVAVSGVIAAASIAHGAVLYLAELLPLPQPLLLGGLVLGFTVVAALGVRGSVALAAILGALEIAGLLVASAVGLAMAPDYRAAGMLPSNVSAWGGVMAGASLAFFAFIGFESVANLAEETRDATRTVPRGIVAAVGASLLLYLIVATSAVLADQGGANPLLSLFEGRWRVGFAALGFLSVSNGVLVQIIMLARLGYGLAAKGQLPAQLARVHPRTGTPLYATWASGALVLAAAMALPFERLLALANVLALGIFCLVDLSLWRLRNREAVAPGRLSVPAFLPVLAALLCAALIAAQFIQ